MFKNNNEHFHIPKCTFVLCNMTRNDDKKKSIAEKKKKTEKEKVERYNFKFIYIHSNVHLCSS